MGDICQEEESFHYDWPSTRHHWNYRINGPVAALDIPIDNQSALYRSLCLHDHAVHLDPAVVVDDQNVAHLLYAQLDARYITK